MKTIEYKVVDLTPYAFIKEEGTVLQHDLTELGKEGWELTVVHHSRYFIFKRNLEGRVGEE